jgi:hypothetical protein
MVSVIVAICLISASPAEDRAAYEAAKSEVGRDPDAHIKLALWCEAHGLSTERLKHLAIAVLNDPKNATARGLLGLVAYQGQWKRPEQVGDAVKADAAHKAALAGYREKRVKAPNTADGQWALAVWCEQNGLKDEARAHFTWVVRFDPGREAAWKRLGYKKHNGRWTTEAQLAAEKEEAQLQKKADQHWKPLLEKWRGWLTDRNKKAQAEDALAQVSDPRAVPMVIATFGIGDANRQAVAVQVLGQIDAPGASRALAVLSVLGKSADVRRKATETLKRRDLREFADLLIALVRDPIKYEVRNVQGPGSSGALFIEGKKANYKRLYSPPPVPYTPQPGDQIAGYDANGLPILGHPLSVLGQTSNQPWGSYFPSLPAPHGSPAFRQQLTSTLQGAGAGAKSQALADLLLSSAGAFSNYGINPFQQMILASSMALPLQPTTSFSFTLGEQAVIPIGQMTAEANTAAAVAQQQLQNDVESLELANTEIRKSNERVLPVLAEVSGQDFGPDREAWQKWWIDQVGFRIMPQKTADATPTIIEDVPLAYQPFPVPIGVTTAPVGMRRMSCFGAGTLVRTLSGAQPIETLRPGDVVLTQNVQTGALGYQPILDVHHNPPSRTFHVGLGDETIVSSEFHRFWKAGQGWVMARDLKPGDTLRTLGGLARVSAIDSGSVQTVFNLDVAEDADFFVGRGGALVHDNTLPDFRLAPFDAPPRLASATDLDSVSAGPSH